MNFLIVFLGAGIGGALRHGVNLVCLRLFGPVFPWGTIAVNIIGSTVMGALAVYFALRGGSGQGMRLFLTTGMLGGFTTFSTFSLDTLSLFQRGDTAAAIGYVALSLAASLVGLSAAMWIGKAIWAA